MKKSTIKYLADFVSEWIEGEGGDELVCDELVSARDELVAELNRGQAKAEANRAVYEKIHDAVIATLKSATQGVTAQELAYETGFARGKIAYGLNNYWANEVEKKGLIYTYRQ